jgi:membrane protein DedA with SNARE-associated domain
MAEFWAEWGWMAYGVAFVWSFLEGETFVIFAAAAGHATGVIDPIILLVTVWIGSFCGDQLWFALGRRYGRTVVRKIPGAEPKLDQALRILDRWGTIFILTFRFIYGVRNVASVACGMHGIAWRRFAFLNFIAAGLWATSFVAAGWFLGSLVGEQDLVNGFMIFGGAILAFILIKIMIGRFRRKAAPVPT